MRKEITNPVGKWWVVANRSGDLHVTDGEWVDPRKEGLFWSEEDFNFDFDKLLGTVKFPELNKGERIEMNLQFEFGIK